MPKKKLSHVKITTVFPQTPPGDAGVEWEFSDVFMRLKIFVRSSTLKKNINKKLNTAPSSYFCCSSPRSAARFWFFCHEFVIVIIF